MYVKFAFSLNHKDVVKNLFEEVKHYIDQYSFRNEILKEVANLKIALTIKRAKTMTILCEDFDHDIEIINHLTFAQRLCKSVLIYMSDFDVDIKIREELEKTMKRQDIEIDLSKLELSFNSSSSFLSSSMTLTTLRSSSISFFTFRKLFIALFTSFSRVLSSLAEFEFKCYFSRINIFNSTLKLLASRLFSNVNEKNFTLVDFIIHSLSHVLQVRRVLFDSNQQALYYILANQELFELLRNENLQNILRVMHNFLKIDVRDQKDLSTFSNSKAFDFLTSIDFKSFNDYFSSLFDTDLLARESETQLSFCQKKDDFKTFIKDIFTTNQYLAIFVLKRVLNWSFSKLEFKHLHLSQFENHDDLSNVALLISKKQRARKNRHYVVDDWLW